MAWRSRRLPSWAELLLISAIIFGFPALISARIPPPLGAHSVEATDPDYVFIGNSMLETRIDLERVAELTGGGKMVSFTDGGLGADAWYLRVKNYVVGTDANPQAVFVFFQGDALTDPRANQTGAQFDSQRALMGEAEPEYHAIVIANSDLTNEADKFFRRLYPVQDRRSTVAEALQRVSGSTLMPDLFLTTGVQPFVWRIHAKA